MQTNCEICDSVIACNNVNTTQAQTTKQPKFNIQNVLNDIDLNK